MMVIPYRAKAAFEFVNFHVVLLGALCVLLLVTNFLSEAQNNKLSVELVSVSKTNETLSKKVQELEASKKACENKKRFFFF